MSGYVHVHVYGRHNEQAATYFASLKGRGGQRTVHSALALVRGAS